MAAPEQKARNEIDKLLQAAGWVLQDKENFNRNAALGVAVREFQLPSGPCDYLLFVKGKAAGVLEAKPEGYTLSGVAEQSEKYMQRLPAHLEKWSDTLIFDYESTGKETFFRNMWDPRPRSRRLFAFHQPETLYQWLINGKKTLRSLLKEMPLLDRNRLRDCQIDAIKNLEISLAEDRPRALIQMATGAGKTFTACTFSYRLIKYSHARRILFLVDRNNLGDQTLKEFQQYHPPGASHRFAETYIVQHLQNNHIDKDAKVVITTVQRLYSMLRGEELDISNEETSGFETWESEDGDIQSVDYNSDISIETFDFIIVDECHRSIYGVWRQVLEYFDAHIIGLTATPSKNTLGFFNQNLVSEYPYERSVADGVNVGYEVFRIRTQITEQGSRIEANYTVPIRDRRTRAMRYRQLDDDLEYNHRELDRSVTAPNQIRTVIQCFKEKLFTELFPDRSGEWIPKTLIFAKDDNHAEEIVHIVREIFGESNDFAKKITYRNTGEKPKTLIKAFRVDPLPRIAVTVDMIATGTDIKPVEILIFMRDVKSEGYYEQMKGRGVRSVADADLKSVTPDAKTKTRFILIDAVGVAESKKHVSQPLERKRALGFDKLLDQIAQGRRDEDGLSSLAGRLAALDRKLDAEDRANISNITGNRDLCDMANSLLDAIDMDKVQSMAMMKYGKQYEESQLEQVQKELTEEACQIFDDPKVRQVLKDIKQKSDIVIDDVSTDAVISADYDLVQARQRIASFKKFIEDNKDELTALQILYNQPYGKQRLTYAMIKELVRKLGDSPHYLTTADVWQAYKRLEKSRVRGAPLDQQLTEIVSLVRFALGLNQVLEPFSIQVEQRFNLWMGRQKKAGMEFTPEQQDWLRLIRNHIAANVEISERDFSEIHFFSERGGLLRVRELFGMEAKNMLENLQLALVA